MYSDNFNTKNSIKKEETIKNILTNNYELQVIIRRVMGRNWKKLNPKEQKKVSQLIIQLSIKNFIRGLEGKSRPLIKYGKTIQSTPKRIEIPITVIFNKNKIYNIEYRLGYLKTGWQIFDIIAEEISIVSNYRQQINDHFRKKNGTELIEKLNELLNKNNK
jgi:phospholipid transport system substrate-binding protein